MKARELVDPHFDFIRWRCVNGEMQMNWGATRWESEKESGAPGDGLRCGHRATPERLGVWIDLQLNPT